MILYFPVRKYGKSLVIEEEAEEGEGQPRYFLEGYATKEEAEFLHADIEIFDLDTTEFDPRDN